MFCEKCGSLYNAGDKFCTKCGASTESAGVKLVREEVSNNKGEHWYHRLGTVVYVFFHLPLLFIVPLVWSENSTTYVGGVGYRYEDTPELAFWYSFLTIVIWLLVLRLIKIAFKYIVSGIRPKFKDLLYF